MTLARGVVCVQLVLLVGLAVEVVARLPHAGEVLEHPSLGFLEVLADKQVDLPSESYTIARILGQGQSGKAEEAILNEPELGLHKGDTFVIKTAKPRYSLRQAKCDVVREDLIGSFVSALKPLPPAIMKTFGSVAAANPSDPPLLVTEFIEGTDISKLPRPSMVQFKDLYKQGLVSLAAMHDAGVYHRDLQPENLRVTSDGKQLKFLDFGNAVAGGRMIDDLRSAGCLELKKMSKEEKQRGLFVWMVFGKTNQFVNPATALIQQKLCAESVERKFHLFGDPTISSALQTLALDAIYRCSRTSLMFSDLAAFTVSMASLFFKGGVPENGRFHDFFLEESKTRFTMMQMLAYELFGHRTKDASQIDSTSAGVVSFRFPKGGFRMYKNAVRDHLQNLSEPYSSEVYGSKSEYKRWMSWAAEVLTGVDRRLYPSNLVHADYHAFLSNLMSSQNEDGFLEVDGITDHFKGLIGNNGGKKKKKTKQSLSQVVKEELHEVNQEDDKQEISHNSNADNGEGVAAEHKEEAEHATEAAEPDAKPTEEVDELSDLTFEDAKVLAIFKRGLDALVNEEVPSYVFNYVPGNLLLHQFIIGKIRDWGSAEGVQVRTVKRKLRVEEINTQLSGGYTN